LLWTGSNEVEIRQALEEDVEISHQFELFAICLKQLAVLEGFFARLQISLNPDRIARHDDK
jgi:hypothetical protein